MGLTILMDDSKFLKISTNAVLYEGENKIDMIQFLIPFEYDGTDLTDFTIALEYTTPDRSSYVDILEKDEDLYKEKYIRCTLPVTTRLTKLAGDVQLQLTMNKVDSEQLVQYTLHTSKIYVTVHSYEDFYKFSDESLKEMDKIIGKLDAKIGFLNEQTSILTTKVPNDLGIDSDGTLKLSINNKELIGTGVNVGVVEVPDDNDDTDDGIIDITGLYSQVEL